MTHAAQVTTDPRFNREAEARAHAHRELARGVSEMLWHYKTDTVEGLPHDARLYLASLFYAAFPDWMDDFSAGEVGLHATLLANLKADATPGKDSDPLLRQRVFYVRCQKWLVDNAIKGIEQKREHGQLEA